MAEELLPPDAPLPATFVDGELFPMGTFPERPEIVELSKKWEHTGKIVTKDEDLCNAVCTAVLLGAKHRQIARKFQISRHSIHAIVEVLTQRGKLAPLKQRLSNKLGAAIELAIDNSIHALEENAVPANVLPVMAGIFFDKKERLELGGAGETAPPAESTPEQWRAKFEAMKRAKVVNVVSVESSSNDAQQKPNGNA